MKKQILFTAISILSALSAIGQVVTQFVNFDTYQSSINNDFVNNFSGGNGLTFIQNSGITGGCLDTPDSVLWGNSNAVYCSRFHPIQGDTIKASICFKFDISTIHANSFQRGVSIWMQPNADFNHYIIATVNYNQRMELITYGWTNSPGPVASLQSNHWYRFTLNAVTNTGISSQVIVKSEIFDLGLSGTSSPVSVNSSSGTFNDNVLATDTSIYVSMSGTAYGGAKHLDDFEFNGRKGVSNCITSVGIAEAGNIDNISIYPLPAVNKLHIEMNPGSANIFSKAVILDATGVTVLYIEMEELKNELDISRLQPGIYFIVFTGSNKTISKKLIILNQ